MSIALLSRDANLFDFFHQHVGTAIENYSSEFSEESVYYLSNLLVERSRRSNLECEADTLVELRLLASCGDRSQAIRAYRQLGDIALYMTGFFRRSIERRNVGLNYYLDMGSMAYHRLSQLLGAPDGQIIGEGGHKSLDAIFEELARQYRICSEVLQEVRSILRSQSSDTSDRAILALYEEWLETGSAHVARRLNELGICPSGSDVLDA